MYLDRFSDPGRIPKDKSYGYCHKYEPAHSPVLDSREKRQLRHILRDSDSERIQHRSGKSHMCGYVYHAHTSKVIIAKRSGKRNDNGNKGNCLLTHAENGTKHAEKQHDKGDDNVTHAKGSDKLITLQGLHLGYELHDTVVDSLCTVHDPERSSDNEHERYDTRLLAESLIQGGKHLPCLRFAPWDKPCGDGTDKQNCKNDYVCIRNLELSHIL